MLSNICKRTSHFQAAMLLSRLSTKADVEKGNETQQTPPNTSSSFEKEMPQGRGERGVNMVILMGRVGRDPELRGNEERQAAVFPLATSQSFKDADGTWVQRTQWHRIAVFRPFLRDFTARNIRKGDKVHVTGSLNYRQVTIPGNKSDEEQTSQQQQFASIVADDVVNITWNAFKGQHGQNLEEKTE